MDDPIPPALTPEEWAARDAERPPGRVYFMADGFYVDHEHATTSCPIEPGVIPAVIALANAARPDDDPGKITGAMVEALSVFTTPYAGDPWAGHPDPAAARERMYATLRAAMRAIQSLLPPK